MQKEARAQAREDAKSRKREDAEDAKSRKREDALDDQALDDLIRSVQGRGTNSQIRAANKRIREELTNRGVLKPVRGPQGTLDNPDEELVKQLSNPSERSKTGQKKTKKALPPAEEPKALPPGKQQAALPPASPPGQRALPPGKPQAEEIFGKGRSRKSNKPGEKRGRYEVGGPSSGKGFSEPPYGWHFSSGGAFDYSEPTDQPSITLPETWRSAK